MDSEGDNKRCMGKYTYDNQGKSLQTFKAKVFNEDIENEAACFIEL